MKRLPAALGRDDLNTLLERLQRGRGVRSLHAEVEATLRVQAQAHRIYGKRAEYMFARVCGALGSCRLIKRGDAGEVYTSERVAIPDFRVFLNDGKEFLIEVKTCRDHRLDTRMVRRAGYADSLAKYGDLSARPVFLATYWSRWKFWTLINVMDLQGAKPRVATLKDAMMYNEMAILGDTLLGAVPPITFTIKFDPAKTRPRGGTNYEFTIAKVVVHAGGRRLRTKRARTIAWTLAMYGTWEESVPVVRVPRGQRIVDHAKFVYQPHAEERSGANFEFIGWRSQIATRMFQSLTVTGDDTPRIDIEEDQAISLPLLTPQTSAELPLWSLVPKPPAQSW